MRAVPAAALALVFAAALAFAAVANSYYVFVMGTMALTAITAIGLNILLGLSGQVSFGHVGFYAIGAYTVAILTVKAGLNFWLALPAGVLLAALTGALLALPALRVRGPYLAMVTVAFGFVVENGAAEWRDLTGGQNGIMGVPQPQVFGFALGERGIVLLAIVFAAALVIAFSRLSRSSWGSAMRAVKDSEIAAESIGLNPVAVKALAFTLSAACAGLAGALFAPLSGFVTPSTFAFLQSLLFVLVVIVGGAGTVSGPIVGAAIVVLLPELLSGMAEYRLLFFGALMLVVLWLAPAGIAGEVMRWLRRRRPPAISAPAEEVSLPAAPAHTVFSVAGLSIAFGGIKAVSEVGFTVRPGTVTSLIGPNGAGKTTVLNLIGGFCMPESGTVKLGDVRIERQPAWRIARAGIARTYQTSQLFGSLSVIENLVIASPERSGTEEAARRLLAFIGYRGDPSAPAVELAHVDRRLVEIARALATRPAVLLLDEPAAGLSREDKSALSVLLRRIADSGVTVVLVEHDMPVVMAISDRIVVLDAGMEIAAGAPADVQRNPAVRSAYLGEGSGREAAHRKGESGAGKVLLDVSELRADYGAEPVLKGMDLQVREGEFVAALGANGAGKSTLMHALCGLLRPVHGRISFGAVDVSRLPAHRVVAQGVVLVPEGRQVFPELSVLDNIRLGGYLRKDLPDSEIERVLDGFPKLRERLQQRAGLLSGGEQQMLAIARGLMAKPRLLLLDEPSLGLAPLIVREILRIVADLRKSGVAVLLVEQNARAALQIADYGYVLETGEVAIEGPSHQLQDDPKVIESYLGLGGKH